MESSEDLAANLKNYEIQLQQVLAALEVDGGNEELLKLKADLEEVIQLTKELMGSSSGETAGNVTADPANHGTSSSTIQHQFKAGDRVMAPWSVDGLYYEARIEDVTSDGQCTVSFSSALLGTDEGKQRKWDKSVSEVCLVDLLKPLSSNSGLGSLDPSHRGHHSNKRSASHLEKHKSREQVKAKQQKRLEKLQSLEEERERDKRKWQDFAMGKKGPKKKGLTSATGSKTRVSIFASPDGVDGRVGVGTCGISGKPMTPYVPTTTVVTSALATHKKKTLTSGLPSLE